MPQLHEERRGTGTETLVFVHGLGGSTNTWYPQSAVLTRDFATVAYDLRGSGRSPLMSALTIADHVDDLARLIEGLGGRAHVAAHSMGTIIAQRLAATRPELISSLALAGGFPAPAEAARQAIRDRAAKVRDEGMISIADAIVAGGTSEDTRTNNPAAAAFVRESILAQSADGYAANCEALAEVQPADLGAITCPVLLLNGDADKTAPLDGARAMASQLAQAEAQVLIGCGHWPTIERAKQVTYALTVFYARQRRNQDAG